MSAPLKITNPQPLGLEPDAALPQDPTPAFRLPLSWIDGQMRIVWAIVLLYAAGFVCFYPEALTNFDEVSYVRQAVAFSHGSTTVDSVDPFTGQHQRVHPSDYPAGTSLLMVPFVWIAGWRGAFVLGLLTLAAATIFTARWIQQSGESPLYALAVLGYAPAMVMARTGMSDVPSACLVAAALWLFWKQPESSPWPRAIAGFLAGLSFSLREPNPLLFAIFFAGAAFRRERHIPALILGGLAGVAFRPISAAIVFGTPFFRKDYFYGFSGLYAQQNVVMYLTAVLILLPGGLLFTLLYRGPRWVELITTVMAYLALFINYNYNGAASGGLKQWMLALRFLIPLTPIVAFAMAKTCSRAFSALVGTVPRGRRASLRRFSQGVVAVWLTVIILMGFFANWRIQVWARQHKDLVEAIYGNTDPSQPIMADQSATVKFVNELYGPRMLVNLDLSVTGDQAPRAQMLRLLSRYKTVQVVLFGRDESDYWLSKSQSDQAFMAAVSQQLHASLKLEQRFPALGMLRIWIVSAGS